MTIRESLSKIQELDNRYVFLKQEKQRIEEEIHNAKKDGVQLKGEIIKIFIEAELKGKPVFIDGVVVTVTPCDSYYTNAVEFRGSYYIVSFDDGVIL